MEFGKKNQTDFIGMNLNGRTDDMLMEVVSSP